MQVTTENILQFTFKNENLTGKSREENIRQTHLLIVYKNNQLCTPFSYTIMFPYTVSFPR